jgi:oligogalacturonide lyase
MKDEITCHSEHREESRSFGCAQDDKCEAQDGKYQVRDGSATPGYRGKRYPAEGHTEVDTRTGVRVRQITSAPAIHHHPFFMIPAYDDAMHHLVFISHRTGQPEIFMEERTSGDLVQLTERGGIAEWSIHPSRDGRYVYYTAGAAVWRVDIETYEETCLVDFGEAQMRDKGMVASAMGTTALSPCDRWYAVKVKQGDTFKLVIIDTERGTWDVILQRDTISHVQFCPDDSDMLFYAGPLTDRVWVINRDGSGNRRLYERQAGEWITHESWIPGTWELAFVDWPNGIHCVHVDTGIERRVTSFNAWHAICNREGTLMVADTNFPDIGLQLFNPRDGIGEPRTLCYPEASSVGAHWAGPFPYADGPIQVYAPQHTHPHPSFSPDSRYVVFTSDCGSRSSRSGYAQVYEAEIPVEMQHLASPGEWRGSQVETQHFAFLQHPDVHPIPDGVWAILMTPFHEDGTLDWAGLEALIEFYVDKGVAGLFALGSSSEFLTLQNDERLELVRRAVMASAGRLPIVATGNYGDTLAEQAASINRFATLGSGVAAVIISTSILPSAARLDEQMLRLADLTNVPLGIYECPLPAPRILTPEETRRLAISGRFVMMKDTCRDMTAFKAKVRFSQGTPLKIFQANWKLCLPSLAAGARGFCGIVPMVAPELASQVCQTADATVQQEGHAKLMDLQAVMVAHAYPASVKYILQQRGLPVTARCRVNAPDTFTLADRREIAAYLQTKAADLW